MAVEEGGHYGKIGGRGVMTPVSFLGGGGGGLQHFIFKKLLL